MQATILVLVTPNSIECRLSRSSSINRRSSVVSSAMIQNHYAVLGVSPTSSFAHIKKAIRLLALKVLSDETTRNQYDRALKFKTDTVRPLQEDWDFTEEINYEVRLYKWSNLRRRMRYERFREKFNSRYDNIHFDEETENKSEEESDLGKESESFIEVIKSAFLALLLLHTIGARLSLTFALMALFDRKLDSGYKIGYMIAWVLGGRGGLLLTVCLSFASWICGKTSSSLVSLVFLAMWVGSNIARYAPLPQGALLALLYMSIKLQSDLN